MSYPYPTAAFTILLLLSLTLTGCGGGGGGTNIVPEPEPIVSPVFDTLPFIPTPPYEAHQLAVNAPTAWEQGYSGQGTTIAVIDSGINITHTDFTDRSGVRLIDEINATGFKFDNLNQTVYQVDDYQDTDGHGTYVSSIASGQEYGIAPSSAVLPIKVFFDQYSIDSRVIDTALPYAATRSDVINTSISGMINPISIGITNSYDIYKSALKANNVVLVTAAGNDNTPIGVEHFDSNLIQKNLSIDPQLANKVLNVISVDENGVRSIFSNFPGSCADVSPEADIPCDEAVMTQIQKNFIAAPGEKIKAASHLASTSTALVSGTSIATPIVSGSISLLLSAWDQLTPMDAVSILKDTANRDFAWYNPEEYGVGIVDVAAALQPVGLLTASTSGAGASVTLNQSTASIPAAFLSMQQLSALQNVAYFDDYRRDFAVDLTPNIRIDRPPINWNTHWQNTNINARYTQNLPLGEHQLSITYDPTAQRMVKQLTFSTSQYTLRYDAQNTITPSLTAFSNNQAPNPQPFISNTLNEKWGESLAMQLQLSPTWSLLSDLKWVDSYSPNNASNQINRSNQLDLTYQATPQLRIGFGVELRQEHNALANLKGEGTLSFGQENQTQLSVLSALYQRNNTQLYGILKSGHLIQSKSAAASYISLQNATIGQSLFGIRHQLNTHQKIGIQAYRTLGITSANMTLTLPTGMNADGIIQTTTQTLKYRNDLLPNTLEMYYSATPKTGINYTLNLITDTYDSGMGIYITQRF
ncbi:hypothetical protein MNBD_GAMMA04-859 [hydrothermal vent metagenome]|uniref:Peptidase S8/S53 domain-containing protein n=1 Tax=hydrothermal vent metagenome TaxID=652676 RepID=A0A3B0X0V4_9ZZZZ